MNRLFVIYTYNLGDSYSRNYRLVLHARLRNNNVLPNSYEFIGNSSYPSSLSAWTWT